MKYDLKHNNNWENFYKNRHSGLNGRYPTEWVVRTLAGGNYPELKIDKSKYLNSRILDMGCGDGRNLPLLLDLGFEVHACEVKSAMVSKLKALAKELNWPVSFTVGRNSNLSYPDCYFDYMLCCASCYYLDSSIKWTDVRAELARVIKPGGLLIANFADDNNAVLSNSIHQPDGSTLITSDPFGLRNGIRFMVPKNKNHTRSLLQPQFKVIGMGQNDDNFYGLRVSGYLVVAKKL